MKADEYTKPRRLDKYLRGLGVSYANVAVAVAFTAITIPWAVHILGWEGWGLWVICQQSSAFICMIETFTQSGFVRVLVSVKDCPESPAYKKLVLLGFYVSLLQGVIFLAAHLLLGWKFNFFFPAQAPGDAWPVILVMAASVWIGQLGRVAGQILYVRQNQAEAGLSTAAGLGANLALVGLLLPWMKSPVALAWAYFGGTALTQFLYVFWLKKAGAWPTFPGKAQPGWGEISPMLHLGRQFFAYGFLGNAATVLPTLLIGRLLPLEQAGIWGVLQRVVGLASLLLQKISGLAAPALMEMHARNEQDRFLRRSRQLLLLQNSLAGVGLGVLAGAGTPLLAWWLGQPFNAGPWLLPSLSLAIYAELDQRLRIDIDTLALQMKRAVFLSFVRVGVVVAAIVLGTKWAGLDGAVAAMALGYALIMVPLATLPLGCLRGYTLDSRPTWIGWAVGGLAWFLANWVAGKA
jgi:O-antigen/teichoic acid export membrane protein